MKTKNVIKQTFARLVREQSYESIRISDVAAQAQVARATFYLHYGTKEELMISYIDDMFQAFYDDVEGKLSEVDAFDEAVAVRMFESFRDEASFSQLLRQSSVRPILYNRFQNYLARLFGRMIRSAKIDTLPPEHLQYLIDYGASGSLSILASWVAKDFQPDSETMGKLYFSIVRHGMWQTMGISPPPEN